MAGFQPESDDSFKIEPKTCLSLVAVRPVALVAVVGQNWANVAVVVHRDRFSSDNARTAQRKNGPQHRK